MARKTKAKVKPRSVKTHHGCNLGAPNFPDYTNLSASLSSSDSKSNHNESPSISFHSPNFEESETSDDVPDELASADVVVEHGVVVPVGSNVYDLLMLKADLWGGLYADQTSESVKSWISKKISNKKLAESELSGFQNRTPVCKGEEAKFPTAILGFLNPAHTNICYVNCAIQTLLSIPPLLQQLASWGNPQSVRPFHTAMYQVVNKALDLNEAKRTKNRATSVTEFLDVVLSKWQSEQGEQHDAGEFLNFIIQGLNDECKWKPKKLESDADQEGFVLTGSKGKKVEIQHHGLKEDSPMKQMFGGRICYTTLDKSHKTTTISYEPFFVLHGFLTEEQRESSQTVSMSEIIQSLLKDHLLDNNGIRKAQFENLPMVLVVCVSRFYYDKSTFSAKKIFTTIAPDEVLTIPTKCIRDSESRGVSYELRSIVSHHGSTSNEGHYTTVAKRNGSWYEIDDEYHRKISTLSKKGYLFAYLRTDDFGSSPSRDSPHPSASSVSVVSPTNAKQVDRRLPSLRQGFGFGSR